MTTSDLRIAIIGTGLIGGSIGLGLRGLYPDMAIIGFDQPEALERAIARGAISKGAASSAHAVRDADVVFVATPLSATAAIFQQIAGSLKSGCVVTDTGSVKSVVEGWANEYLPEGVHFLGGHPMAGSEKGGIDNADPYLLENASYVLCPPSNFREHPDVYGSVISLLESIGARILLLDSARHDKIAAAVSHIPQLVSVALTNTVATQNEKDDATLRLAAGGFRDMTRIASSPYKLWRDILVTNHSAVLDGLADLIREIQSLRNRLIEDDLAGVEESFDSARIARESIPKNSKGFLRPLSDVYVNANDRPGVILAIAKNLFDAGLSIKDIELLKLREGTGGTFRLGFDNRSDSARAIEVLIADGHQARQL